MKLYFFLSLILPHILKGEEIEEPAPTRQLFIGKVIHEWKKYNALDGATLVIPKQEAAVTQYLQPSFECPASFYPINPSGGELTINTECYREAKSVPSFGCLPGFLFNDGVCEAQERTSITKSCPKGFVLNYNENMCERYSIIDKQWQCAEGFTLNNNRCEKPVEGYGTLLCNTNESSSSPDLTNKKSPSRRTDLVGTDCMTTILEEKAPQCDEPGHELFLDGTCAILASPTASCPPGYNLDISRRLCLLPSCPNASPKKDTPPEPCEVPVKDLCQSDFELIGNKCVSIQRTVASMRCGVDAKVTAEGRCERVEVTAAVVRCPENTVAIKGNMCRGTLLGELVSVCPKGSYQSGSECVRGDSESPIPSCPNGFTVTSHQLACEKRTAVNLSQICPPGLTLSEGSCIRLEKTSVRAICPGNVNWTYDHLRGKCRCHVDCQTMNPFRRLLRAVDVSVREERQEEVVEEEWKGEEEVEEWEGEEEEGVDGEEGVKGEEGLEGEEGEEDGVVHIMAGRGVASGMLGDPVDVVTISTPPIAPRTVYYPQYVVHGKGTVPTYGNNLRKKCNKKKGCDHTANNPPKIVRTIRVITPISPASPVYNPTGRESTIITRPLI